MAEARQRAAGAKAGSAGSPRILSFDIGGSGIKGMVLSLDGAAQSGRVRQPTPETPTPKKILKVLEQIGEPLRPFDRIACGFPGVIKHGTVYTAHNLHPKWVGVSLEDALAKLFGCPARVINDAAMQGLAAVKGSGVELVLTLGTGLGSSLFIDGILVPGLELAHHPFRKGKTYEEYLGRKGLDRLGEKRWNKLLGEAIVQVEHLFNYDHLYLGGGNNKKVKIKLPENASLVANLEGLMGGAALWRRAQPPVAEPRALDVEPARG